MDTAAAATASTTEDVIVPYFRQLLNEFKRPYLEDTEERVGSSKTATQDLRRLQTICKEIESLYRILRPVLERGGAPMPTNDMNTKIVIQVFENRGILRALRENPELKAPLLRYLELDLITYPYTLSMRHVDDLATHQVPSYPTNLIPNTM